MTANDLLAVLSGHIGGTQGIKAKALADHFDVPERQIRTRVNDLREDGVAVCGHPSTGYYIAATQEELEQTCQFLRSRALHSLHVEARLRKITLPDLIGQMKLQN